MHINIPSLELPSHLALCRSRCSLYMCAGQAYTGNLTAMVLSPQPDRDQVYSLGMVIETPAHSTTDVLGNRKKQKVYLTA